MTALILFAILVVLLIATGLMPGLLRAIGGFLILTLLVTIFSLLGLAYGVTAVVLIIAAFVALIIWEERKMQKRLAQDRRRADSMR